MSCNGILFLKGKCTVVTQRTREASEEIQSINQETWRACALFVARRESGKDQTVRNGENAHPRSRSLRGSYAAPSGTERPKGLLEKEIR